MKTPHRPSISWHNRTWLVLASFALSSGIASNVVRAQDEAEMEPTEMQDESAAIESEPAPAPPSPSSAPVEATPVDDDGARFRWGINAAGGYEIVTFDSGSVSGPMFGADARFGLQLNDLLGIYVSPHMAFASLDTGGGTLSGATGTFAVTVGGDVTFNDLFFAGAGVGYGVLNNPSGLALQARAGIYPLMSRDDDGPGRSGLMLGADLKTVFIDGATGILVTACLGYESF